LATANPPRYITGPEAYQFFVTHFHLTDDERELYRRLLLEGPIRGRYLGVDRDEQFCEISPDQQLARFQKFATSLATAAARDAMSAAGLRASDVGGLVVNTCTGYLCPGLSSYLTENLGLDPSIKAMDLMGMGCGAAIPNLQSGAGLLALGRDNGGCKPVLCVSVEVCSATIFMGPDPGLTVSNCLFGDGAAAAVLDHGRSGNEGLVQLLDFECGVFPEHREELRYGHEGGRLRNVLSKRVPVIGARAVRQVAERLLARHGLTMSQIDRWIVHPGGTAVLEQVQRELGVSLKSLRISYEVLHEYGNMSSPSVLFVLKRMLDKGRPGRGQKGLMLSFGAGFSAFAVLVEF
jgi:alkylresorcinol/alkylpyrone synthase